MIATFGLSGQDRLNASQEDNSRDLRRVGAFRADHNQGIARLQLVELQGRRPIQHLIEVSGATTKTAPGPSAAAPCGLTSMLPRLALSLALRRLGISVGRARGNSP